MTNLNVAEWEWASQEHPPQFPTRQLWRTAVATVAASAKRALPDALQRIDQAVKLIHNGSVELLPNGTAKVASQSDPKAIYEVKGKGCTCPAALYRAKDGWCQHLFAALIVKRATTLVKQKLETSESSSMPVQQSAPESLSAVQKPGEASASCTLTFALSGVDVMLTLHSESEQALFPRIRHSIIWAKGLDSWSTEVEKQNTDKSRTPIQNDQT